MESRQSEFSEERIIEAINVMEDKTKVYLEENNMLESYADYPVEDLCRIVFGRVLDLDDVIVIDFALKNCDMTDVMERGFVGWIMMSAFFNYEDFDFLLSNRISAEEKENLNNSISAGNNHKNNGRL